MKTIDVTIKVKIHADLSKDEVANALLDMSVQLESLNASTEFDYEVRQGNVTLIPYYDAKNK